MGGGGGGGVAMTALPTVIGIEDITDSTDDAECRSPQYATGPGGKGQRSGKKLSAMRSTALS